MSAISLKSITGITSITTPAAPDNQITLHTLPNTVERVRITSGGNVGINSTIPRSKLHVANGGSHYNPGNPTGLGAGAVACLESSGDVALQFLSSTTTDNFIYFGDTSSATTGSIQYDHNVNALLFNVNGGTERLRIDSNGNIQLGSAANPGNALRYFDVYNLNTGTSAGSIIRLITTKSDGSSTTSADIVKYKTGGLVINNNEVLGTTGFISFGTGTAGGSITERLRITSAGQVQINGDGGSAALTLGASQDFKMYHDAGGPTIFSDGGNQGLKLQIKELILTEYTGVTERFRIKSNGQVDIASNNYNSGHANTKLRVGTESGSTEATAVIGSADQDVPALTITNWDGSATTNKNVIRFDNSGRGTYEIGGVGGTNAFAITVDSSERARIDSNGDLNLGNNPTNQYGYKLNIQDSAIIYAQTASSGGTEAKWNLDSSDNNMTFGTVTSSDLRLVTSNVPRLTVKSGGSVGIGTDNPNNPLTIHGSGNQLYLKDTATNNIFQIRHAAGVAEFNSFGTGGVRRDFVFNQYASEVLRIDSSGRVLIGTTTEGFAEADDLTINSADHGGVTIRTPTNKEGNIAFSDTTSGTGEYSGLIRYRHSQNDLGLWTNSNLRFLINSGGQVLIGTTTNPAYTNRRLTVYDSTNSGTCSVEIRGSSSGDSRLYFTSSTTAGQVGAYAGKVYYGHADNVMAFYTAGAERLRIDGNGAVGLNGANYGTAGQVLTSQGSGQPVEWRTIVQAPIISSITGNIFASSPGNSLTLTGQHFGSAQGTVNFSGGSLNPSKNVNVTPTSDTSMTVTVPSDVANNVNSGETITIKFTNSTGLIGSGTNTTVLALPSGGTITTSGNYRIHTFTSSSNFVLTKSTAIEYLVVAGGGGGGGNDGGHDFSGGSGGGGAGGYRTGTVTPSANTHTVTVGGGGSGNNSAASGADGSASAFGSITTVGGGGGGACNNAGENGRGGGSGGGAGGDDGTTVFTGGATT